MPNPVTRIHSVMQLQAPSFATPQLSERAKITSHFAEGDDFWVRRLVHPGSVGSDPRFYGAVKNLVSDTISRNARSITTMTSVSRVVSDTKFFTAPKLPFERASIIAIHP